MLNRRRIAENIDDHVRGGAVSIGNFDGVHRGHAVLISRLRAMADHVGGPAIVVTFEPSPAAILRPDGVPPQLTNIKRRSELLRRCGVDHVIVCKTDRELLSQTAEEFFQQLVVEELGAKGVVEGPNFYFGAARAGDTKLLQHLCLLNEITVEIVEPQTDDRALFSSTRVRELLVGGDIENANAMLTAPYLISGEVVRGSARGRKIGYPTANLAGVETLVPGAGVYGCRVFRNGEIVGDAAANIGPNPTFGEESKKIEVHLLDFEGDLYGADLDIEFHFKIREVVRFSSAENLLDQLKLDIAQIRARLDQIP